MLLTVDLDLLKNQTEKLDFLQDQLQRAIFLAQSLENSPLLDEHIFRIRECSQELESVALHVSQRQEAMIELRQQLLQLKRNFPV